MIEITAQAISPERVISKTRTNSSGCVVSYVGLIRDHSRGRPVLGVEYQDIERKAESILSDIASEARRLWQVNTIAISHRVGKLKVGDINLVVAVASGHRVECFAACQYIIDQFKQRLLTQKEETYQDSI